jgi:hypothetical protein
MPLELGDGPLVCQWISGHEALEHFATYSGATQSQQHIKPLHWYVACRLVIEGGFHPDEINPHPPFEVRRFGSTRLLVYNPAKATGAESTILGGLKTKNVDVVVTKPSIGPVLAISCKGTIGAFRNLTNRMEEAVGDCTNLHITYPALVAGFMSVIRANRLEDASARLVVEGGGRQLQANDIAIQRDGTVVESVVRYHYALRELTGRQGIRDDVSRYEAVSLALVDSNSATPGQVLRSFPAEESALRIEPFFQSLYRRYDERYVYAAPDLKRITQRIEWVATSPALVDDLPTGARPALDFLPRLQD